MLDRGGSERESAMLALLRRKQILEELQAKGGVRLTELSEELSVSEMTIRRDLDALQKDGLIERVHGGAVLAQVRDGGARLREEGAPRARREGGHRRTGRGTGEAWFRGGAVGRHDDVRVWPAGCPLAKASLLSPIP